MLLWFIFAAMTALATLAVLWPLSRARRGDAREAPETHDIAVYRDQLDELERDRERGLIAEGEAEAARTEIARRMLRVAEEADRPMRTRPALVRGVALAVAVGVPAVALGLYVVLGSPGLPGQPLQARLESAGPDNIEAMVARVERHLAANPDDVQGWRVLAPIYARYGRFQESARAWREVIRIEGPGSEAQADLGEMLVAATDGLVEADAEAAFEAALAADPANVKARFYRGLGHAQAGRFDAALADFDRILATSAPGAPWLDTVRRERAAALAARDGGAPPADGPAMAAAPGPDAADVAAAAEMTEADRSAMIGQMVDGLAERLRAEPNDAAGWQRLIRAYAVLGRTADARAAFETASATFAAEPEALAGIRAVAAEAGVSIE